MPPIHMSLPILIIQPGIEKSITPSQSFKNPHFVVTGSRIGMQATLKTLFSSSKGIVLIFGNLPNIGCGSMDMGIANIAKPRLYRLTRNIVEYATSYTKRDTLEQFQWPDSGLEATWQSLLGTPYI
jgi:hypothetical protein